MKSRWNQYKEPILYLFFGILTTVVNILIYQVFTTILPIWYLLANALAWAASVAFAFVTNKIWVFESRATDLRTLGKEAASFVLARGMTGVMDMVLMWILIDLVHFDRFSLADIGWFDERFLNGFFSGEMIAKILVNVLVILLNYILSKVWIFRKEAEE